MQTLSTAQSLAASWHTEAQKRRTMSKNDPTADILDYCADEMLTELKNAAHDDEALSVAEYAAHCGRAASTVRRWCQLGMITCQRRGREYVIRRGEPCPTMAAAS